MGYDVLHVDKFLHRVVEEVCTVVFEMIGLVEGVCFVQAIRNVLNTAIVADHIGFELFPSILRLALGAKNDGRFMLVGGQSI